MLMLLIVGFYHSAKMQKSLEATLKWLGKQRTVIRKKTLISPNMRRMKQTLKMSYIQLSCCKIYNEKQLINIASGQVAPSEIKDILTAHEKGCNISSQFFQQ